MNKLFQIPNKNTRKPKQMKYKLINNKYINKQSERS